MNNIIREDTIKIIEDNKYLKDMKNKTFAITGANGMIGSYIIFTLLTLNEMYDTNIEIIALVRDPDKLEKIISQNSNVKVVKYDVVDELKLDYKFDYMIHAASPASPLIMKNHPFETNIANTVGTYNTINFAIKNKITAYLFVSSREIYGEPNINQEFFIEDGPLGQVNPLIPRNGYAIGKKAAENLCVSAKEEYGLNTKIVRLAHTYGPGMSIHDGRVQADFLKNALYKEDIIMKSEGTAIRTYTYIADATNAIFKVLLESSDTVYNVSNENDKVSIKQLAEIIAELGGVNMKMQIPEEELKGVSTFSSGILSSRKIEKELCWQPHYNIKEGFRRTLEYLKYENNKGKLTNDKK